MLEFHELDNGGPQTRMNRSIWVYASFLFLLSQAGFGESGPYTKQDLEASERFIDAFYSFDPDRLRLTLRSAETSIASILYYQGWAEGGNYSVIKRHGCNVSGSEIICPVTVKDDLMLALGINFNVTDSFHLTVNESEIRSVTTSSNDLQVFHDAEAWVWRERRALVDEACAGYFEGGETPGDCVRAMVRGFREYTETKEFAAHLSKLEIPE